MAQEDYTSYAVAAADIDAKVRDITTAKGITKTAVADALSSLADLSFSGAANVVRFGTLADAVAATALSNGSIAITAGRSLAGDGGGNTYVYRSSGAGLIAADGGFYILSTGVSGAYLEAVDKTVANVRNFGAGPNFTAAENSIAIQSASDAADSASSTDDRRLVVIPPGQYDFDTPLIFSGNVNLDMRGAQLTYTGSDYTQPAVTLGHNARGYRGSYLGIKVYTLYSAHYWPDGEDDFCGVRIRNLNTCLIEVLYCHGFNVGMLLHPDPSGAIAYNELRCGQIGGCRVGIELRGNTSDGYVNENKFYSQNLTFTSDSNAAGTVVGVKFSKVPGGYTGQNNNTFYSTTFQVENKPAAYDWSSGMTVGYGKRYYSDDKCYVITSSGTSQTAGTDQPTVSSGTFVDNAGVSWKYDGEYLRIPVLFNGAGSFNHFYGCRWESGYGPFAAIRSGTNQIGVGNTFELEYVGGTTQIDDLIIDPFTGSSTITNQPLVNSVKKIAKSTVPYPYVEHALVINDMSWRTIIGTTYMTVAGFGFINISTGVWSQYRAISSSRMCVDGIISWQTSSTDMAIALSGAGAAGWEYGFAVSDVTYSRISTGVADRGLVTISPTASELRVSHGGSVSGMFVVNSNNDNAMSVGALPPGSTASYLIVALGLQAKLHGFVARPTVDRWFGPHSKPSQIIDATTPYGATTQRRTYGTPTAGFFTISGEYIPNINTTASQPHYFTVTTPGYLAPDWAATTAVKSGEMRKNASKVYYASAAGTTGATAPTHTSGSASDDTVTWVYLGSQATLTASSDTY